MNTNAKKMVDKYGLLRGILLAGVSVSAIAQPPPQDPDTFLTFLEHFVLEDSVTAAAYYAAVDPLGKRTTFADWLEEAGFIADAATHNASGDDQEAQSNAFAFALYRNAADLGFVRRMFIRCNPSCTAANPTLHTYVENYFYLEGTADPYSDGKNRTNRIATVTFDWVPPANEPTSAKRFGTIYAYKGPNAAGVDERDPGGVPFAPDLDGRGAKQNPGVCLVCHGGFPQPLNADGTYPNQGEIKGFKFLPFDLDNFEYADEAGLRRADLEDDFKRFNQVVLLTHKGRQSRDDQGVLRFPAGDELIRGWYAGFEGDRNLTRTTFNSDFIPKGWRRNDRSKELYLKVIAPACRGCHVEQGLALDFATEKGFNVHKANVKELALRIECGLDDDPATVDNMKVMPAALLTYDRFWLSDTQPDILKDYYGLTGTSLCDNLRLFRATAPVTP
jgi:hypothetical protein